VRRPLRVALARAGHRSGALLLALAAGAVLARPVLACATCYGAVDSPMTAGMNNAIATLLAIVATVQVGFVALFWSIRRRTRRLRDLRARLHVVHGRAL
jgi:hypothetical protein